MPIAPRSLFLAVTLMVSFVHKIIFLLPHGGILSSLVR